MPSDAINGPIPAPLPRGAGSGSQAPADAPSAAASRLARWVDMLHRLEILESIVLRNAS